jgi:signal transduction histidine kinase
MSSIRLRLLLGAVVGVGIALAIAGVILVGVFEAHIRERYIKELDDHLLQLAAALQVDPAGAITLRHDLSDPAFQRPLSGLYWQVADGGQVVLRSRSLWDEALPAKANPAESLGTLQASEILGPRHQILIRVDRLVLAGPAADRPLLLSVAGERSAIDQPRRSFTRTVGLSLMVLAVLLAAASWVQVGAGLAPLRRLRLQLIRLRRGEARRLEGDHPEELSGLVEDLNGLIEAQAEEAERARANAGKLGHGLKTPLALLAAEARGLREKGEVSAAEAIEREVETMNARVAQTLAAARAAGRRTAIGRRTALEPVLRHLVSVMKRLPPGDRLDWFVSVVPADAAVRIDRRDLDDLFGNLLDNARKWARSRVLVTARGCGGDVEIMVDDDGQGIPRERVAEVLAGGVRLDRTVSGTGIGLSIAKDLAELHGGSLDVRENQWGGTRIVVRILARHARISDPVAARAERCSVCIPSHCRSCSVPAAPSARWPLS